MAKEFKVNKKYTHFAVRIADGKIVNGWETISDVESLKYYAKTDLKDMDLDPKDFKILSKQHLVRSGIDPFNWANWRNNPLTEVKAKRGMTTESEEEEYDESKDLFVHYQKQPKELKAVLSKWEKKWDKGDGYKNCANMLKDVKKLGYTFEYYLDAEPYFLRKMDAKKGTGGTMDSSEDGGVTIGGTMASSMKTGGTTSTSLYDKYINNIYERQSEHNITKQLNRFATENGFDDVDIDEVMGYEWETEENAWGDVYYTKDAIKKIVYKIADVKYKTGATIPLRMEESIGSLEKKLQSAEKRCQKARLQEQIGDISGTELNAFEDKLKKAREKVNNWYKSKYGSQSMKKGATIKSGGNGAYLDSVSADKKDKILRNIANHYGVSLSEAETEVRDADSEMLYEYITNDALRIEVYNDLERKKYAKGSTIKGGSGYSIGGL